MVLFQLSKLFHDKNKKRSGNPERSIYWRRHPDLNWGIKVLQTLTLPLGYSAVFTFGGQTRNRTRDTRIFSPLLYRLSYLAIFTNKVQCTWRRPTLPHSHPCSTIGAEKLNHRVRYGNGCSLLAIITRYKNILLFFQNCTD
jgi:hypothetical protein